MSAPIASAAIAVTNDGRDREVTTTGRERSTVGTAGGGSVASVSSIAGNATAPAVSAPLSQRATCTAQSLRRGSPYSRVPSSGSTIHTRSWRCRRGSSAPSSDSRASSGRADDQLGGDEGVGGGVTLVHQQPARRPRVDQVLAQLDEPVPRLGGEARGEGGIRL